MVVIYLIYYDISIFDLKALFLFPLYRSILIKIEEKD